MRTLIAIALVLLAAPFVESRVAGTEARLSHWPNGKLQSAVECRRGPGGELLREGRALYYDENGHLSIEGHFAEDLRQGRWRWYRPDGSVRAEAQYDRDHGHFRQYRPNGQLELEGDYEGDRRVGEWVEYYPSGRVRLRGSYVDGRREGRWTAYTDADSPATREAWFHDDRQVASP